MKKLLTLLLILPLFAFVADEAALNWIDITAMESAQTAKKQFIFIDLYTDWCGWCKRMDASTFKERSVIDYMKSKYHSVKFNAERTDSITFQKQVYPYLEQYKIHQMALALFNGQSPSYPTFIVLGPDYEYLACIQGYQQPEQLLQHLKDAEKRYDDYIKTKK